VEGAGVTLLLRVLLPAGLDEGGAALVAAARAIAEPMRASLDVAAPGDGMDGRTDVDALVAAFDAALDVDAELTLLPDGDDAREIAARLAVRRGAAALGRCASVELREDGLHATRECFGGRALATLVVQGPAFATLRAPKATPATAPAIDVRRLAVDGALPPAPAIERREIAAARRRLEGARIVVSGGRGMAGPEGFAQLDALAGTLGAALGGSLPTVDAGWVPVAHQVGQSGRFVTPEVYVAVGISGTPQHLAGIGPETRIVAINRDPEADIFRVAELGIVGEWQAIVPALVDRLRAA
jgi:electron transfer flavoprotein alpha subunit